MSDIVDSGGPEEAEYAAIPPGGADPSATISNGQPTANGNTKDHVHSDDKPELDRRAPDNEALRKFCRRVVLPRAGRADAMVAVPEHQEPPSMVGKTPLQVAFAQTSKLWDTWVIDFTFLAGDYEGNHNQQRKVRTCMDELQLPGAIILCEVADPMKVKDLGSRVIRITFDDRQDTADAGSWSTVGTDCKLVELDRPTMNLGWVSRTSSTSTPEERAIILHQLGHALGLDHEHQSMACGGVPIANVRNAFRYFHSFNNWDEDDLKRQMIDMYNSKNVSSYLEVDKHSIMHYPMPAEITGLPYDIPYQYSLSDMDKAYMQVMYPSHTPDSQSKERLQAALVTTGMIKTEPEIAAEILALADSLNVNGGVKDTVKIVRIRALFSTSCNKTLAARTISSEEGAYDWKKEVQKMLETRLQALGTPLQSANRTPSTGLPFATGDPGFSNGVDIPSEGVDPPTLKSDTNGHSPSDDKPKLGRRAPDDETFRKHCREVLLRPAEQSEAPTTVHEVLDARFSTSNDRAQAMFAEATRLWNKGKVPIYYMFLPGPWIGTEYQHAKVRTCIKEWELYGSFRFEEVTEPSKLQSSASDVIRITFDSRQDSEDAGSWSALGTDCKLVPLNRPTMNLGWVHGDVGTITGEERAVILHEFGHVLGLLHEHQSVAGGGVPISNIRNALRYYHSYSNWVDDKIKRQVIDKYNQNSISSYSKVDRHSIMHYPMPAEVTGLPYDIPYQYSLSQLDKAYMQIMYPSHDPNQESARRLQAALVTTGMFKSDPETAAKILELASVADSNGVVIDVQEIRALFSAWCRRAIPTISSEGATDDNGVNHTVRPSAGTLSSVEIARIVSSDTPSGPVRTTRGPMCQTQEGPFSTEATAPTAQTLPLQPERMQAVVWEPLLKARWSLDMNDDPVNKDYLATATYSFAPCPMAKSQATSSYNIQLFPSPYRIQLFEMALLEWSSCASITFTRIPQPLDTDPKIDDPRHLTVVFQDYHYGTGAPFSLNDVTFRSYHLYPTRSPVAPSRQRRTNAEYEEAVEWFESQVPIKHSICYRGLVDNAEDGAKPAPDVVQTLPGKIVTNEMAAVRSLIHEVGHWLGLQHEDLGAYGAFIFEGKNPNHSLISRYRSTKIDTGSVMDSLMTPPLLSAWIKEKSAKAAFRAAFKPSIIDRANIAFLHPGRNLTPELIDTYGKAMHYNSDTIFALTLCLELGRLDYLRSKHLSNLLEQQEVWAEQLDTDVTTEMQKIVGTRLNALEPPILHTDSSSSARPPSTPEDAGLLGAVYSALNNAFGPRGSQFLSLQFPTRYLSKEEFAFNLDGIYSNFVKPATVIEAEARLVDALYDPAPIVGGPNGKTLSAVYGQSLNNLVPRYEPEDKPAREQRERMRAWLLTEVGDQNPFYKLEVNTSTGGQVRESGMTEAANKALLASKSVKMRKMTRMEFANQLTQDYLDAQTAWELERESLVNNAITTRNASELETVTRKLVHVTAAHQNKLSMKYADSVVRGYSHVVREALGQLDVSTTAENLQDAKDSYRATAVSSLYSASKVYPVLMSPVDWAMSLDTSFSPEDLADSPDLAIMMIQSKSSQLDNKKTQLALLQGAVDGDPATLKAAVESAARNLDKAEATLNTKYLDSTIELAKIVISLSSGGAVDTMVTLAALREELEGSVQKLDPLGTVVDIGNQISAVGDAQRALQQATSVYASKSAALARAEATDTRTEQSSLQRSIDALTIELADLRARFSVATSASQKLKALNDANPNGMSVETLASAASNKVKGGSRWQSVFVIKKMKYTNEDSDTNSDFSMSRWSCNFWVGSKDRSDPNSGAAVATANIDKELDVEISMKVTLVTVDRSGWFQPQILENSTAFMQNNSNYRFSSYPAGSEDLNPADMAKRIREELVPPSFPGDCPVPCFTSGIILCKDVSIKVSNMDLSSESDKQHFLDKSQASRGFLCFNYNRASEHREDSSHANFSFAKDGMIVKIPGPQILGYIQQMMPSDKSTKFDASKSLASEFYLPPELTTDLAKNTEDSSGSRQNGAKADHFNALPERENGFMPSGFQFQVGRTTMTPKGGEATPDGIATKSGAPNGAQPGSAHALPLHNHDGTVSDVFKHIVDTLQGSDDILKNAVKTWLNGPSSVHMDPPNP